MRVLVLVKHVPELLSARGFDAQSRTMRSSEDSTLNEVDENAVEAALTLADGGDVTALTLGPPVAVEALRRALAMGADTAVHIVGEEFAGSDVLATARALAAAVRHLHQDNPIDVVVTGLAALDGLGAVVPSLIAAELGWPQLTGLVEVSADGDIEGRRDVDGVTQVWQARTPVVVSVTDIANDPRMPKVKDLLAARSAPVLTLTAADLGLDPATVGAAGSSTRVVVSQPRPPHPGPVIVTDDDGEGGAALAAFITERLGSSGGPR